MNSNVYLVMTVEQLTTLRKALNEVDEERRFLRQEIERLEGLWRFMTVELPGPNTLAVLSEGVGIKMETARLNRELEELEKVEDQVIGENVKYVF